MCLLSYVKLDDQLVITSNRDISIKRPAATPINQHHINGKSMHFPRDHKGGSWLVHNDHSIVILLNGGDENHVPLSHYRKSRGLILLEIFSSMHFLKSWEDHDLSNIEPFTLIFLSLGSSLQMDSQQTSEKELHKLVWDGENKHQQILDPKQNHIWLSSTLYEPQEKEAVISIFETKKFTSSEEILTFNCKNNYTALKKDKGIDHICTTCHHQFIVNLKVELKSEIFN